MVFVTSAGVPGHMIEQESDRKLEWEKAGGFWVRPEDFEDLFPMKDDDIQTFHVLVRKKYFFGLLKKDYIAHCKLIKIRNQNLANFYVTSVYTADGKNTHVTYRDREAFAESIKSVLSLYLNKGPF